MIRIRSYYIYIFIFASFLNAQFGAVSVTVDNSQLKGIDRRNTDGINSQLKIFFESTTFDNEYDDLDIPLIIQLLFEGVSEKSGERVYSAQCLFSNGSDQRYFAKFIQFPYSTGQGIIYSPVIFEPVSSIMEYYAYIILAGEADTYEPMGGTKFYERARELAIRGLSSLYTRGWSNRVDLVDILSKNYGLRQAKFYYYEASVLIDEGKYLEASDAYAKMIKNFEWVTTTYGRERYTTLFLNAHARDLANIPRFIKNRDKILSSLIYLAPDDEAIYKAALKK